MTKRTLFLLVIISFIIACHPVRDQKSLKKFADEFSAVKKKFDSMMTNTLTTDALSTLETKKTTELNRLLKKYDKMVGGDQGEILKSKILIEISRFNDAERRIDKLIAKKSDRLTDARIEKIKILAYRKNTKEALKLYRLIEKNFKAGPDLFSIHLYFALHANDGKTIKEFSKKFLKTAALPKNLGNYKPEVYARLAAATLQEKDLTVARGLLKKGIAAAGAYSDIKKKLELKLAQLGTVGKPAPPISAWTWINSAPLKLEALKGKVVIIEFLAAWSKPCQTLLPPLEKAYQKYKDKGLVVIGLTRLYGKYSDDKVKDVLVDKVKELELLKDFFKRNKLTFPIAVSTEGAFFNDYKVSSVPTTIFINQKGTIDYIGTGKNEEYFLENKIKELLEAK